MDKTIYTDTGSNISRAGLRQTDLSAQLENSKKSKFRSVMYHTAMAKSSKTSILEESSLHSGVSSTDKLSNYPNQQINTAYGYPNTAPNFYTHQNNSQGGYMNVNMNTNMNMQLQYPHQNHQMQNQQHHPQNHPQYHPQQQQQQQQYYANNNQIPQGYPQQHHLQGNPLPKQREAKKNFRESYMYLDSFGNKSTTPPTAVQGTKPQPNLQRISGSPSSILQRRFSSQNGVVMGSPISANTEENARKISLNALMGVKSVQDDDDINVLDTLDYMNSLDPQKRDDANEWESIDEEGGVVPSSEPNTYFSANRDSILNDPDEAAKIIQKLQVENRGLKKKLKDIELGHDSNSIVASDEKYSSLENDYDQLYDSFKLLDEESKDLLSKNKTYRKDNTQLKEKLRITDDHFGRTTAFTKSIIERLPNFIKKEDFLQLVGKESEIPENLKDNYLNSFQNFKNEELQDMKNTGDGFLNDEEIIKLMNKEIKQLNNALQCSNKKIKQMDKIYGSKIDEERRTIRVSAIHSKLHDEFIGENPLLHSSLGLRNLKLLEIVPPSPSPCQEPSNESHKLTDIMIIDPDRTLDSETTSISGSPSNFSDYPHSKPATPVTPTSDIPIVSQSKSSNSLSNRIKSYSTDEDSHEDFYSVHSKSRVSTNSVDFEYETFTT